MGGLILCVLGVRVYTGILWVKPIIQISPVKYNQKGRDNMNDNNSGISDGTIIDDLRIIND